MSEHKIYGVEDVLSILATIVSRKPDDYFYPEEKKHTFEKDSLPMCRYWHGEDGTPGCLVGAFFHEIGVSGSILASREGHALSTVAISGGVDLTREAEFLLEKVQSVQDRGFFWKTAVTIGACMADSTHGYGSVYGVTHERQPHQIYAWSNDRGEAEAMFAEMITDHICNVECRGCGDLYRSTHGLHLTVF